MKKMMFNDKYGLTASVLSGRKTQTRRVIPMEFFTWHWDFDGENLWFEDCDGNWHDVRESKFANRRGEIIAVAQSYETISEEISKEPSHEKALFYCEVMKAHYPEETDPRDKEDIPGWHNKMFVKADLMPHQIRITNVRVERLQDISEEDCLKEGIYKDECQTYFNGYAFEICCTDKGDVVANKWYKSPCEAYAALIDKVSGKGTWESNPYVFVYDFELVK